MLFPNLTKATYVKGCDYWLMFGEKFLSGDGNDYVAGYNNRTSGMKPGFRLFCVAVNILKTEACGS